jgi:type I restriction enzyme R subunit
VRDPETGVEYTEPGMNTDVVTGKPISEAALPARFESPDYQVLLVANKYQTGFDQPLLAQCTSTSARRRPGRADAVAAEPDDPGKDAPFVLDFVNDAENIYRAFKPYYDKTELAAISDPSLLNA